MIEVISFPDKDAKTNTDLFPFVYLEGYRSFLRSNENKKTILFNDENDNTLVCKQWKNKFLTFIQPQFPPLDKDGNRLSNKEEQFFLNDLTKFIKDKALAHRITQPENFCIFQCAPKNSISTRFGTYFLNLEEYTEEELFKSLHTKHRNVIRNAEKNNVSIKYGIEVLNDFYLLYKQTMERSAMYCQTFTYFMEFYKSMPENIICGVAYLKGKPLGALFMPFTKFGAFYLYGASAAKTEVTGSMNYLHWETIKLLKEKQVKRYDFVGARLSDVSNTKLEGIQKFKERFGSSLEKGILWKKDLNKLKCGTFDNLVKLKLHLKNREFPLDIIDQERKK